MRPGRAAASAWLSAPRPGPSSACRRRTPGSTPGGQGGRGQVPTSAPKWRGRQLEMEGLQRRTPGSTPGDGSGHRADRGRPVTGRREEGCRCGNWAIVGLTDATLSIPHISVPDAIDATLACPFLTSCYDRSAVTHLLPPRGRGGPLWVQGGRPRGGHPPRPAPPPPPRGGGGGGGYGKGKNLVLFVCSTAKGGMRAVRAACIAAPRRPQHSLLVLEGRS